jgi:hypothetical protein
VDESVVSGVNRDMADLPVLGEQHQIPDFQRARRGIHGYAGSRHLP